MLYAVNTFSVQNSNDWYEELDMLIIKKKSERNYSKIHFANKANSDIYK